MKEKMPTKNKNEPLVLVVDDFADAREMYGEYLKFCGFRVAEAQNGVEAIDKAKRLKPDLILMDLSMPVVDGWEATRRLKADASTKGIPVVALTGTRWPAIPKAPGARGATSSSPSRACRMI